jgi:hypothetical protein
MSDSQNSFRISDRLPSLFVFDLAMFRGFERDAVFRAIAAILVFVPFKMVATG